MTPTLETKLLFKLGGSLETQIKGILPNKEEYFLIDIFGYSSKGLPGIEIVGLGPKGKNIKEKFVYMGRLRQLQGRSRRQSPRLAVCVRADGSAPRRHRRRG